MIKSQKPNFSLANKSAAEYFGGKPISFKFTSNSETAERAYIQRRRRQKKNSRRPPIPFSWWAGVQVALDRKGRKHLIFVNKNVELAKRQPTLKELEETGFHEFFHAYFERYRRSQRKKVYQLATEMAAHIATLEYVSRIDKKTYNQRIKSPKLDLTTIDSIFAERLSELIHKEFDSVERRQMIGEIQNGHFATKKQVISWLLRKLKEKNIQNEYVYELTEYQKKTATVS